ncbi:MAG: hypothetical protein HC836_30920 [Richelia sp. RM2_1_2]|nr:hypothetical protein [Richelia sp. RM1_1_1]NJO62480.1 hypothetical protein [Richelia sp. RM2_1_2]
MSRINYGHYWQKLKDAGFIAGVTAAGYEGGKAIRNAAKHGAAHQAKLNKVGALFGRIF